MSRKLARFPLRAVAAVLVCKERGGDGWLALSSSHGWLFGSRDEARREALWLAHNRGGLPIRELSGGVPRAVAALLKDFPHAYDEEVVS